MKGDDKGNDINREVINLQGANNKGIMPAVPHHTRQHTLKLAQPNVLEQQLATDVATTTAEPTKEKKREPPISLPAGS